MIGTYWLIVLGALLAVGSLCLAAHELVQLRRERRQAVLASASNREERALIGYAELGARFERSRPGRWLANEMDIAGIKQQPLTVAVLALVAGLVAMWLVYRLLAPALAVFGLLAALLGLREFLHRARQRRTEAFVNQLPELARVLANASGAGLSLPTALALAADELGEPAHTELSRLETRLRFGAPLTTALDEMRTRIDSREVSVLMSTLVVASRSGGSLVTALRDVADALEDRKETRREVTTILSQSMATAYMVIAMGFGMLLVLNLMWPGTVDKMVRNLWGRIALAVSSALFAGGFIAIRRMTRIPL